MKNTPIPLFLLLMILILALSFCTLPTEQGPMPKKMDDTDFTRMLNIFGILRADGQRGNSFIHLERTLTVEEMYSEENPFIENAFIEVHNIKDDSIYIFSPSTDSMEKGYYYDSYILPKPGERYAVSVFYSDYPEVYGETLVPGQVQVDSLYILNRNVMVEMSMPDSAYSVEISIAFNHKIEKIFFYPDSSKSRIISVNIPSDFHGTAVIEFAAYDQNYTLYQAQAVGVIPQTYHEIVSTVENGYGVFGSMAVIRKQVEIP